MIIFDNMNRYIIILAIAFIIALLLMNKCNGIYDGGTTITTDTVYIHDTTIHVLKTHNFKVVYDTIVLPSTIDTGLVINDYYTNRIVVDSLVDSLVAINIVDSLVRCELNHRTLSYRLLKPQQVITTTTIINKAKNVLYAGGFINSNYGYGISANYSRQKSNFSVLFDIRQKQFILGYSVKIYSNN